MHKILNIFPNAIGYRVLEGWGGQEEYLERKLAGRKVGKRRVGRKKSWIEEGLARRRLGKKIGRKRN